MKETTTYLKKLLKKNDSIVLACSGGPDSMCLLGLLISLKKDLKLNIICAHINHNLRKESLDEEEYVKNYCEENNIVFEYLKIDQYSDDNFHNEARKIRYSFFESLINKYNAKYLMTAHHSDDLIETILMRITRGSTLKGYAGFQKEVEKLNYTIVRPLIYMTKEQIIKYDEENNIDYFIDKSNYDDKYTRNRYRSHILPFLKKEDKQVHQKFLKFQKKLLEYDSFVNNIIDKEYHKIFINNTLDIPLFNKQENLVQTKIIERILNELYNDDLLLLSDNHIKLIIHLAKNIDGNNEVNLPNGINVIKSYNKIYFEKSDIDSFIYEYELIDKIELPNNYILSIVDKEESTSNFCTRLNSEELLLPLRVRTRQDGDKIEIKNMNGHKKINDILIDEKISTAQRNLWPIITDANNDIVWIPGLKKSKFDKDKHEKYDIILKYEKKKGETNEKEN